MRSFVFNIHDADVNFKSRFFPILLDTVISKLCIGVVTIRRRLLKIFMESHIRGYRHSFDCYGIFVFNIDIFCFHAQIVAQRDLVYYSLVKKLFEGYEEVTFYIKITV